MQLGSPEQRADCDGDGNENGLGGMNMMTPDPNFFFLFYLENDGTIFGSCPEPSVE